MSYGGLPKDYNPWPDDPDKNDVVKIFDHLEKLTAKVSKSIQLTEHDIYYLERLEEKPITKDEQYSNEHDIRDESNHLGFDDGGEG